MAIEHDKMMTYKGVCFSTIIIGLIVVGVLGCKKSMNGGGKNDLSSGLSRTYNSKDIRLVGKGKLDNINLKEDYAYIGFSSNKDYLVIHEGYFQKLIIYNLKDEKVEKEVQLTEGRGPNEVGSIMDIEITKENVVHMSDNKNAKILSYSIKDDKFIDTNLIELEFRPTRIEFKYADVVTTSIYSKNFIVFIKRGNNRKVDYARNFPSDSKILSNPFAREGYLEVGNKLAIFVQKYTPSIYVFDMESRRFIKKAIFADAETAWRDVKNRGGKKIRLPPKKADIVTENIVSIGGINNRILILAEGKGENRNFKKSHLYEYDVDKEIFVHDHDLEMNIDNISSDSENIYVFNKESLGIYRFSVEFE
jgi:hypothetical protein